MRRFVLVGAAGLLASLVWWGCPSDNQCSPRVVTTTEACTTTQQCIDGGYKGLTCINGLCGRGCTRDEDCLLDDPEDEDMTCATDTPDDKFVCEAQLCVSGCPSVP